MNNEEYERRVDDIRRRHSAIVPPDMRFEVEGGWLDLIDETLNTMKEFLQANGWTEVVQVRQIKEKFGALRIYARPERDVDWPEEIAQGVFKIRYDAEEKSTHICEICSEPGEIRIIRHYHQCLCKKHAQRRQEWADAGWPDVEWR